MEQKIFTSGQAVDILKKGGVGVMPTDTVYGVVASATNDRAVERLYALKQRERKPGTLVAASLDQLRQLGVSERYFEKLAAYWPGPLSAILPVGDEFAYLHQGVGDIAIRVVADKQFRYILEQTGPLVTSSANHPGKPGAVNVNQAWDYFNDQVDFYVDGGDLSDRAPSTIVRITNGDLEVLRDGAVKLV